MKIRLDVSGDGARDITEYCQALALFHQCTATALGVSASGWPEWEFEGEPTNLRALFDDYDEGGLDFEAVIIR